MSRDKAATPKASPAGRANRSAPLKRLRIRLRGAATALGLGSWGFYIPYRYAGAVEPPRGRPAYPALEALFRGREQAFRAVLDEIDGFGDTLTGFGAAPPPEPHWQQDWFARLDGAAAYAIVRRHRPKRIVEVGSGHSTRFLARAVRDEGLGCKIVAIDPAPRVDLDGLGAEFIQSPVQAAGRVPFAALAPGDVLFVDSSHVAMPGSDVDFLVNDVLPGLPAGLWAHFHDIFLPDGYPDAWAWRGYNEQQAVGALIAGGGYEIVFASHYVATRMAAALGASVAARLPLAPGTPESSLWLRKTVPAFTEK